jgi:hypothetical protein
MYICQQFLPYCPILCGLAAFPSSSFPFRLDHALASGLSRLSCSSAPPFLPNKIIYGIGFWPQAFFINWNESCRAGPARQVLKHLLSLQGYGRS